ncbi:MAG: N-6 DNA methylase [Candidatus Methanofastidiosia archaeon]
MGEISDINLDRIVSDFRRVARSSANEEELKIGATKIIDEHITSVLGLDMGRYEYTLVSGVRPDALYGHVLIEYKAPGALSTDSQFSRAKEQIINYILTEAEVKENFKNYFGIIISDKIAFVKFNTTENNWMVRGPYNINNEVALKIVEALRGLRRKKLSAEKLLNDFGPKSETASKTINILYNKLEKTTSPKAELLFQDWIRIFSQITGYSEKDLEGLNQFYDTKGKDYTMLLFCIHTYYALFMKIIAAELAYLYGAGRYLKSYTEELEHKYMQGIKEFKSSMKELEEGGVFKNLLRIRNFIEGGYFSWYLEEFDHELMDIIAEIARKLSEYEPATPVLEPEETKDMLKIIYQDLVPRPIRHNLGEYYTPDWLAQFLLDEVHFTLEAFEKKAKESKDPTSPLTLRLIDPACGSGTFLIEALKRLREYAEDHYMTDMMSNYVLKNIVGMDLNPLAVLAARTNYLLNIGDLLSYTHEIELPIYLADSITIKEKSTVYGNTYSIETQAGEFKIPSRIVEEKRQLEKLLRVIEDCVSMKFTLREFEFRLNKDMRGLSESEVEAIKIQLYKIFLDLENEGKDHIWVTILLNAFAPLFVGKFDFVVGNPPWILWDNLPADYRNSTQKLWKKYGLFTLTAAQARHGGGKKDISILFTYVCNDRYLKDSGTFGFLITQSVFKTKGAGEGFRQFKLEDKGLEVVQAHDFVKVQPFEGASNRTAAIILRKGLKTTYPVNYTVWRKLYDIDQKESLKTAFKKLQSIKMAAIPSDPENDLSPWVTVPYDAVHIVEKVYGKNAYSAHDGINSGGANGVYWLNIHDVVSQSKKNINTPKSLRKLLKIDNEVIIREILVENVTKGMKRKVEKVKTIIEDFFVYPMLKSRNIKKWGIEGYNYALQMQNPLKRIGFDEGWVKVNFPKTYKYFKNFEEVLKERKSKSVKQLLEKGPFFTMYAVGKYTYAPYKVVWNRMGSKITACVVSTLYDEYLGEKLVLPENVLAFIPTTSEDEAHYICSIMNSSITDMILRSIAGGSKSFGTPKIIEDTIKILKYDETNELHTKLATLSKKAHEYIQNGKNTEDIEKEIDDVIGELYKISEKDSETVTKTLSIQDGEIPEEPEELPEPEKNVYIHCVNTVIEPMTESEIDVIVNNPSKVEVTLSINIFGEKMKFKTKNLEKQFKIKINPLEKGEYEIPYKIITPEEEISSSITLYVKQVPKHRTATLSKKFSEFMGENDE